LPEGVRLQKLISEAGLASRREAEDLIRQGRVTVNSRRASLGERADLERDLVELDGVRIRPEGRKTYLLMNKPRGVITTMSDPQGRPKVTDLIKTRGKVFPVGRLDTDTEGFLILTNDGDLAHRLTHPSFEVEKTYVAEVEGAVSPDTLRALREGISIGSGRPARAVRARVRESRRGRSAKTVLEITLHEGRRHVVRRMMEEVGHPVVRLVRTRVAGLGLGRLRPGEYRELTPVEVVELSRRVRP
jgi:23S rRNA pseudouridine2605 synthase